MIKLDIYFLKLNYCLRGLCDCGCKKVMPLVVSLTSLTDLTSHKFT